MMLHEHSETDPEFLHAQEKTRCTSAEDERDIEMDKFTRRTVTAVLVFVLGSVAVVGVPLVVSLYRSVFGG